jgi:hypothetical protein
MSRVLRIVLLSYTADEFTGLPISENHTPHGERQAEARRYVKAKSTSHTARDKFWQPLH